MNTHFDTSFVQEFRSGSQHARVVSEAWFGSQAYCLSCEANQLQASKANAKAKDFVCPNCAQTYELKSSKGRNARRVVDGAYVTMMQRISASDAPALLLLKYSYQPLAIQPAWNVHRLTAIHPVFLTDAVIEARKPLSATAKRAGWQGCNILVDRIPSDGQIVLINEGRSVDPMAVRASYRASSKMAAILPQERGWATLALKVIRDLRVDHFALEQLYERRSFFQAAYPANRHIEAKIRQQLQVLRDLGYLRFASRGHYELLNYLEPTSS